MTGHGIRSFTYTTRFSSLESSPMKSPIAGAVVPQEAVFFIRSNKKSFIYVQLHVTDVGSVCDRQPARSTPESIRISSGTSSPRIHHHHHHHHQGQSVHLLQGSRRKGRRRGSSPRSSLCVFIAKRRFSVCAQNCMHKFTYPFVFLL